MTIQELNTLATLLGPDGGRALPGSPLFLGSDGAIPIDRDRTIVVVKGSAAALTLGPAGGENVGRRITITAGSDFAHVVTFSGGAAAHDGTTGPHTTWTSAAFEGSSTTVEAVSPTKWNVVSMNGGAYA